MTTDPKTRTITLSNRAPVQINEAEWPVIAEAKGDSFRGDVARHRQAIHQGEVDTYSLRVRRHADGRAIVYGVVDAAIAAWRAPAGGRSRRAGKLLPAGADLSQWITVVGEDLGDVIGSERMRDLIAACLADLPAEEI